MGPPSYERALFYALRKAVLVAGTHYYQVTLGIHTPAEEIPEGLSN